MGSAPRIMYTPRGDATPEGEINALAACYRIILDSCKNENAPDVTSIKGDDAKKGSLKHEVRATQKYTG